MNTTESAEAARARWEQLALEVNAKNTANSRGLTGDAGRLYVELAAGANNESNEQLAARLVVETVELELLRLRSAGLVGYAERDDQGARGPIALAPVGVVTDITYSKPRILN